MVIESCHEVIPVETLVEDLAVSKEHRCHIAVHRGSGDSEIVLVIKDIEVGDHIGIGDCLAAEAHYLVKD